MQPDSTPIILTKVQVCERLNISPRTLETMVKTGRFAPPVRKGKYACWTEKTVQAWVKREFGAQEHWQP